MLVFLFMYICVKSFFVLKKNRFTALDEIVLSRKMRKDTPGILKNYHIVFNHEHDKIDFIYSILRYEKERFTHVVDFIEKEQTIKNLLLGEDETELSKTFSSYRRSQ